ncbi:MAG: hypothetical protein JNK37_15405 [Verrucomicrobiales bacterium]|nr:hypothetical protein [Verrucomicrobiales bacterium]
MKKAHGRHGISRKLRRGLGRDFQQIQGGQQIFLGWVSLKAEREGPRKGTEKEPMKLSRKGEPQKALQNLPHP